MIPFNPNGITEANITAKVWLALTVAGFKCYLEYTHENCRFDCVVVDNDKIFCIIEVKRCVGKSYKKTRYSIYNKQFIKYEQFNTPVLLIDESNQIDKLVRRVKRLSLEKERTPAQVYTDKACDGETANNS